MAGRAGVKGRSGALAGVALVALLVSSPLPAFAQAENALPPQTFPAAVGWFGPGAAPAPRRGGCTGVLVAPDLVLTAAHCLTRDERTPPPNPGAFAFAPGWPQRGADAVYRAASVSFGPPRRLLGGRLPFDVVLVRLATPVPADVAVPLALVPDGAPTASLAALAAYPNDTPDAPVLAANCATVLDEGPVFGLTCRARAGFSGGAVLVGDGDWALAGIVVARGPARPDAKGVVGTYAVTPADPLRAAISRAREGPP